ncbi:toprim domain-containing protein [Acetanaerobacterium elongatum]|uniref:Ribonuclease M5 n=1 Tax=Acetanaerobacterium elongatum TaxID=258515 RepID=A0A1H0BZT2_9FIRM|nr:DUF4093 domain-containing protein [Acetanaerobacterium elongatum]SDN51056.1 ribonuclease M5 [Acetanaerobacterium elongatum]
MITIKQAVIVEGKYDKIKLSSIIDAVIIETGGFSIFKNEEQLEMIRALAETTGILVLTDSDRAGFQIRSFIKGAVQKGTVLHAYIPDILGKEKRKALPSKEGKLGVEGVSKQAILEALKKAGVTAAESERHREYITKADLFADGLTGAPNSAELRRRLLKSLNLPERLSTNAMLDVINAAVPLQRYREAVAALTRQKEGQE